MAVQSGERSAEPAPDEDVGRSPSRRPAGGGRPRRGPGPARRGRDRPGNGDRARRRPCSASSGRRGPAGRPPGPTRRRPRPARLSAVGRSTGSGTWTADVLGVVRSGLGRVIVATVWPDPFALGPRRSGREGQHHGDRGDADDRRGHRPAEFGAGGARTGSGEDSGGLAGCRRPLLRRRRGGAGCRSAPAAVGQGRVVAARVGHLSE